MEFVEIFAGGRAREFDSAIRWRIPGYETILQLATAAITRRRRSGSVLSVGCGTGQDVLQLARDPAYRVTAIDPSPDMVAIAAARFRELGIEGVDLRCCSISDLPDEPRWDAALLCFVLHFMPDDGSKDRLLEQIARRLVPGGALVLTDFARTERFADDLSTLAAYLERSSPLAPAAREEYLARIRERLHLIPASEYEERARRAGFGRIHRLYASLHVHGWVLER